ncbi:Serine/threonine-protein phosphatase BSL1-like protein [Hibiscus syriacus]|uniref:Serine/threonine-protein phosphatase n=1 Tax=Hibiscus syriacus TaxID=106335 RepID=A0A6A2ZLT4_HIBSY|nr:Serine/threonine-protein phosphatase BSL1-like protein [Hibiscus syriacus]
MGSKPWLSPAPAYLTLETCWDTDEDAPGPRCGHTLTAVAATKIQGPRPILFGGATAIEGGASSASPGIRLAGVTNSVHSYDVLTRKWTKIRPAGDPPSPRAAHAAAVVGTMVVFQGGIGPAGHFTDDLYVLDLTHNKFKWHRVVVQGQGPGPRYGHVLGFPEISCHLLDTAAGEWLDRNGLVTNSRNTKEQSEHDTSLELMRRCRHAAASIGVRIYIHGGLRGGQGPGPRYGHVLGFPEISCHLLDTAAGEWLDRNGLVTNSRNTKEQSEHDTSLELMRRCRHAAASIGVRIYIHGGLRGVGTAMGSMGNGTQEDIDVLLDDFLVAENSPFQPDINPMLTPDRPLSFSNPKFNKPNLSSFETTSDDVPDFPSAGGMIMDEYSMEKLKEASAAEAEVANAFWRAAQIASSVPAEETSLSDENSPSAETDSENEADVRLHFRAVVVAKEVIYTLLRPRNWRAPANRRFFLDSYEVGELCYAAEQIFMQEPSVLRTDFYARTIHRYLKLLFDEYGFPSTAGDITLETITLLLALKIENPDNVHLIRGNHEASDINALFGFRIECVERMGENDGIWAWTRFNQLFNCLPLAALIEKKIICMHGGIGRSIHSVEQIEKLERPITMDVGSIVLMDLLWPDPTENDSIEGLRPNARGPSLVTFGPDRVMDFCKKNKLQLIIRAHECVMDGFERFAHGQLITLFSATNYCGTANNAGAILVVGRGLVVVPKLIHPLPPPIHSPEASPDPVGDDAWMQELNIQRPPTPTRGRPQPEVDRNSLAYIWMRSEL